MEAQTLERTRSAARLRALRIVAWVFGGLSVLSTVLFMVPALFTSDPVQMAHRIHVTAGGVGILVFGVSLVACAIRPTRTNALAAVCAAGVGEGIGGLLGWDLVTGFWFVGILAVVALLLLSQERGSVTGSLDLRLLLLAAIALVPAMAYALTQGNLQRTAHDIHAESHHYSGMAVSVLIVVLTAAAASLHTRGWRLTAWSAAIAAVLGGAFVVAYPNAPSAPDRAWGWIAIAWGIAVALVERITPEPEII